jgi:hypothetical protein
MSPVLQRNVSGQERRIVRQAQDPRPDPTGDGLRTVTVKLAPVTAVAVTFMVAVIVVPSALTDRCENVTPAGPTSVAPGAKYCPTSVTV